MGVSAEQWLVALGAAGVPAFQCRNTGTELSMVMRTPEFIGAMQGLAGLFDESSLLSSLRAGWPAHTFDGPFTISAAEGPAWRCVLSAIDEDGDHVAILRLPEEWQVPNDAFFSIVETLPDVVIRYDNALRCLYSNPALEHFTGVPSEARLGKTIPEVGDIALSGDLEAAYRRVLETGQAVEIELDYAGPSGLHHYLGRATPEFDHDGRVHTILSVVRDISEVKRLEHQLELLSRTDPLTSLLNRRSFIARLGTELDRVQRGQGGLSLLMLDLNNFKYVNDQFGHVAGDQVLEAVGRILIDETGPEDACARIGGDEFCVALVGADGDAARLVAQRIGQRVRAIAADGQAVGVGVSVGIAEADIRDVNASDLLARVDMLMYQVKSEGTAHTGHGDSAHGV